MLKVLGAVVIIIASVGIGRFLGEEIKRRISNINLLVGFIEQISSHIALYKLPLDEIYADISSDKKPVTEFISKLRDDGNSFYEAAYYSGLLYGDDEKELIRSFSNKIKMGSAEDLVKLCTFTSERLRSLEEKLCRDLPDKWRVYNTVSILAGASAIILLI